MSRWDWEGAWGDRKCGLIAVILTHNDCHIAQIAPCQAWWQKNKEGKIKPVVVGNYFGPALYCLLDYGNMFCLFNGKVCTMFSWETAQRVKEGQVTCSTQK